MKVTWIDVNDRLPEKSGEYLCFLNYCIYPLSFSKKYKAFNCQDFYDEAEAKKISIRDVTHWCELPDPPKGYKHIT